MADLSEQEEIERFLTSHGWLSEEQQKDYLRLRAAMDDFEPKGLDHAKLLADSEARIDNALRHHSDQDRSDPHLRSAAWAALMTGAPLPRSAEEVKREERQFLIERLAERFAALGNPIDAFQAYLIARANDDALPDWVLQYFDDAISNFWSSFLAYRFGEREFSPEPKQRKDPAAAFELAFGINRGRGKESIWDVLSLKEYAKTQQAFGDAVVDLAIEHAKKGTMFGISSLIEDVCVNHSKSKSAGWDNWLKYEMLFPLRAKALRQLPGFLPDRRGRPRRVRG